MPDINAVMQMDPKQLTQRVPVMFDEDGEPEAGFIIVGKDSEQYQEMYKKTRANAVKRQASKKSRLDAKTDEGAEKFINVLVGNEHAFACAVVTDWYGWEDGGKAMSFDKGMVDKMLRQFPSWRDAILTALEDQASFLMQSSKTAQTSPAATSGSEGRAKTKSA